MGIPRTRLRLNPIPRWTLGCRTGRSFPKDLGRDEKKQKNKTLKHTSFRPTDICTSSLVLYLGITKRAGKSCCALRPMQASQPAILHSWNERPDQTHLDPSWRGGVGVEGRAARLLVNPSPWGAWVAFALCASHLANVARSTWRENQVAENTWRCIFRASLSHSSRAISIASQG